MADINAFFYKQPFVKSRQEFLTEEHSNPQCCYEYLYNWVITETNISIKVFIRICRCGKYTSRDEFLSRNSISFVEYGDGVEAHFNNACNFHVTPAYKGERTFRKNCYCKRSLATALR